MKALPPAEFIKLAGQTRRQHLLDLLGDIPNVVDGDWDAFVRRFGKLNRLHSGETIGKLRVARACAVLPHPERPKPPRRTWCYG